VAVVGTGFGCLTHVRCLRSAGLDVVALVGRDAAKTKERADRFGVASACTSLDEALGLPGVDAVTVATPPHTHAALVRAAIAAGKHVVCEKPFARDAGEAMSLHDVARARGVVAFVGNEFRFSPGQALATRAVRDGAVGAPRLASFLLHIPLMASEDDEVPGWWSDASQGGGWLGAQASHVVDHITAMLGPIEGVSAALPRIVDRPGWTAEDAYSVRFRTVTGVDGVLQSTAADRGPFLVDNRVVGSDGTITQMGDTVTVHTSSGARPLDVPPDLVVLPPEPPPPDLLVTAYDRLHSTGLDVGPYTRLFERFRDAIDGADVSQMDPAPATFDDGVETMRVLDAIRASARDGGAWVRVDRP
jgi:predicted dehydrogenase